LYPDTTPENLEKWQIPSCLECNQRLGKLENDLIGRIALTLDANPPRLPLTVAADLALSAWASEARRIARRQSIRQSTNHGQ
jgi:hypothetical protein